MITPTHHEKAEWSRLATDAYRRDRNDVGHRFSAAASLPSNGQMAVKLFDSLQEDYRAWLLTGDLAPAVPFVDVNTITEYGLTQRLPFAVRVF